MVDHLWVAELLISDRTAQKITHDHQIQPDEVRDTILCRRGLQWVLDVDEEYGERVIIKARIRGQDALIVLFDAHHPMGDVWNLGSTYFV